MQRCTSFLITVLGAAASQSIDLSGALAPRWIHRAGCDTRSGKSCASGKFCARSGAISPSSWTDCAAACDADSACQAIAYRHSDATWCHKCASSAWVGTYHDWGIYTKVHEVDLLDMQTDISSYKSTINATIQAQRVAHNGTEGHQHSQSSEISEERMSLAKSSNGMYGEEERIQHPRVVKFHLTHAVENLFSDSSHEVKPQYLNNTQQPANLQKLEDTSHVPHAHLEGALGKGAHLQKLKQSSHVSHAHLDGELGKGAHEMEEIRPHYPPVPGLISWIMFGKVGSSTMRTILQKRAHAMNFHMVKHKDTNMMNGHIRTGDLCFWGHEYHPEQIHSNPLPCATQPEGAVVLSLYHGYCDMLDDSRPCKYMTLLREPIDRLISEYGYFCQSCAEHRLRCKLHPGEKEDWEEHHPGEHIPTLCPNISIIEWAKRHDNPYTRRFSKVDSHELMTKAWSNAGHQFEVGLLHSKSALQTLSANNTLVLFLEELNEGLSEKSSGLRKMSSFLQTDFPSRYAKLDLNSVEDSHKYKPSLNEYHQLREIMRYDVQLYEALRFGKIYYK